MKQSLLLILLTFTFLYSKAQFTITGPSKRTFCAGQSDSISYSIGLALNAGNTFKVELSDGNGNFTNAQDIKDVNSTDQSGTIVFSIPSSAPYGTHYRILLVASAPLDSSADNGVNLTINSIPVAPALSVTGHGCVGADTLTVVNDPSNYPWQLNLYGNDVVVDSAVRVRTVAGGNGTGSATIQLNLPSDIYIALNGSLYVTDLGNSRVQKFPPGSTSLTHGVTVAGGNGQGAAANQLHNPRGIITDVGTPGSFLVSDGYNSRVQYFPPGSTSDTMGKTIAGGNGTGSGLDQLWFPWGIDCDMDVSTGAKTTEYIADSYNHRIIKFRRQFTTSTDPGVVVAGGNGQGAAANQFDFPIDVAVDTHTHSFYVLDDQNFRVQKFPPGSTSDSNGITIAGGNGVGWGANQLENASFLFLNQNNTGYIYVSDYSNHRIQRFPTNGTSATNGVTVAGGNGNGNGPNQLAFPNGIFVDDDSNVYVADGDNDRIQKWAPLSTVTTRQYVPHAAGNYYAVAVSMEGCASPRSNQLIINEPPATPTLTISGQGCVNRDSIHVLTDAASEIDLMEGGNVTGSFFSAAPIAAAGYNGQGSNANQFDSPTSVFVTPGGDIYVADYNNNRIQKFAAGSTSHTSGITVAGGNGAGNAANQLDNPEVVFVDGSGNIYVVDQNNNRIQKFAAGSTGASNGVTIAGGNGQGSGANQLDYPQAIFVDGGSNIYVADFNNNRVQKFPSGSTSATNATTVAGGNGAGNAANQLSGPGGLWVDAAGNIYVSDFYNHRVQKFPSASTSATNGITIAGGNGAGVATDQLSYPYGIYVSTAGNLYVADGGNQRIQKFPSGSTSATHGVTVAGGNGEGFAINQFSDPISVWLDTSGNIFVADNGNHRISEWGGELTGKSYVPATAGSYTAVALAVTGCWSGVSAAVTVQVCAGIAQLNDELQIKLYPNPNNGSFILESSNCIGKEFAIYDIPGKKVIQKTITTDKQTVQLNNLAKGIYTLGIKGQEGKWLKFVVE